MSTLQDEKSYLPLADGKWAKIVVNADGTPIGGGEGGGGGASTIADGADVTQGAVADAANITGAAGTVSGKLRGLITILADVWDSTIHFLKVKELYGPGYENNTTNKAEVEHKYTPTRVTADAQIAGVAGFVHTVTIAPTTATPTAGLLTVYNSLTETGTIVYSEWVLATTPGHSVLIDGVCSTGIYVGYDSTLTNVSVTVSWR